MMGSGSFLGAILIAVLLFSNTETAFAQQVDGTADQSNFVKPRWAKKPSGNDMLAAYPRQAFGKHVRGIVELNCVISDGGTPTSCVISNEDPSGYGFGQASLKISSAFKIASKEIGNAAGKKVVIPIRWTACDDFGCN